MSVISRDILIIAVATVISWLASVWVGEGYITLFNESGGSFVNAVALAGLAPTYIFLVAIGCTIFGGRKKYAELGVVLLPAIAFVLSVDARRWWFYVVIGVIGWAIGFGISKLIHKNQSQSQQPQQQKVQ